MTSASASNSRGVARQGHVEPDPLRSSLPDVPEQTYLPPTTDRGPVESSWNGPDFVFGRNEYHDCPSKNLPIVCSSENSVFCVFIDCIEKEFSGGPVCSDILAVLVESLNHPCDDLFCSGCIM